MELITENAWMKPTVANRGYMFKKMMASSQAFVDSTGHFSKPVLDLGCAYGVATLPVLENHQAVIACDLEQKHLDELYDQVPADQKHLLTMKQGAFPDEIDFDEASISAAHLSHILHFLTGDELIRGLKKLYRWIEPGGRLYINVGTPYVKNLCAREKYETRKAAGERWPGLMASEVFQSFQDNFPRESQAPFLHLFTQETLQPEVEAAGFTIDSIYYDELNLGSEMKDLFYGDGKGILCIIATR